MVAILVVEDANELADYVCRELRSAGYEVQRVADGHAALDVQTRISFDLIILDWILPGLDGLETLRRLRQRQATPVLMLTARGEEADRVLGLEVGADDYLTKPFSMRELLARVRALIRRKALIEQTLHGDQHGASGPIQTDSVFLDPAGFVARVDGQTLDLTRTEFLLLHLLMRNPGRTFNRDYLLDSVWGQFYVEGDRAVDNAVLRLRKKLGSAGDSIETVWGLGYRWHAP